MQRCVLHHIRKNVSTERGEERVNELANLTNYMKSSQLFLAFLWDNFKVHLCPFRCDFSTNSLNMLNLNPTIHNSVRSGLLPYT